jgi:hypothetical protein
LRIFEPTTFGSLVEIVDRYGHTWDCLLVRDVVQPGAVPGRDRVAIFLNTAVSSVLEKLFAFHFVRSELPPSTGGVTRHASASPGTSPREPCPARLALRSVL